MDNWNLIKLSPISLEKFVTHINIVKTILDDQEKCDLFFNRFPFEELLSFTIMEGSYVRLCVKILDFFMGYKEFCSCNERLSYVLEFILVNLGHITIDCQEVVPLFHLLAKIVQSRNFDAVKDAAQERILETMVKLSNFESIQRTKFMYYSLVLNVIVDSDFDDKLNNFISYLFEKFVEHKMIMEQTLVCKLILNCKQKLVCACFQNISQWLKKCPILLTQNIDVDVLEDVIKCLLSFFGNWLTLTDTAQQQLNLWQLIEELCLSLNLATPSICLYLSETRLKSGCYKLLQFILMKFFNKEMLSFDENEDILNAIEQLPEDAENWPNCDQSIFFCICHICLDNGKSIWKPKAVLDAIMRCFYNNRYNIQTFVLKSIYYLYPKLIRVVETSINIRTLGDDMLHYFARVCSLSYLYSYDSCQLKWMLERADKGVKLTVLTKWLNAVDTNETLKKTLISTISACNSQMLLLQLIVIGNEEIGSKAATVLSKTMNNTVSVFISFILPFTIEKPVSFCNILLAEPKSCLNVYDAVSICTLMGAIIPCLNDNQTLKGACKFSGKLLVKNKNNPYAVSGFCRNTDNIWHMTSITKKVDETTGVEIIRLLRLIILIQQRNKIKLVPTVQADFQSFINGSSKKIKQSLCLLYYSTTYKHSLITTDINHSMSIYDMLLNYSLDPVFRKDACRCIIALLKRIPWLAQTTSTSIFIESLCLSSSDVNLNTMVFKLLDTWFLLIRQEPYNGFCWIPEAGLKSFITRGNISDFRKQNYITTLEDLLKRRKYRTKTSVNVFYFT